MDSFEEYMDKPLLVATVSVDSCKIHLQSGTIFSPVPFAKRTTRIMPFQCKLLLTNISLVVNTSGSSDQC